MIFIPKFYGQLGLGQRNKNKYDANERKYERKEERRKQRQELKSGKQQTKRRKTEDFNNFDRHLSRKLERQQKRKPALSTNYEVSPNNERQYNRKLKRQHSRKPDSHKKYQYGRVSMVKLQNQHHTKQSDVRKLDRKNLRKEIRKEAGINRQLKVDIKKIE